ncbi:MAG: hypothetical protein GF398_11830 [Chitinivibrionales bacterium]|nr:hypothetical protein [Chitinivibrionales bacterium]
MMKTDLYTVLLAMMLCATAGAQIVIEEDVETDSIDVFAYEESGKSAGLAMAASLLLPGLGHHYLGQNRKALSYLAFESGFFFSLIYCEQFSRRLFADSKAYAWKYANAGSGSGADDFYWQNVGNFLSSNDFNSGIELGRTEDPEKWKYMKDNLQWRWINDSLQQEYTDIRARATRYHVASSFFIAAMVLNRVVAFIDARAATRSKGITGAASLRLRPYHSIAARESGLVLYAQY